MGLFDGAVLYSPPPPPGGFRGFGPVQNSSLGPITFTTPEESAAINAKVSQQVIDNQNPLGPVVNFVKENWMPIAGGFVLLLVLKKR